MNSPTDTNHILKAVVTGINGCNIGATAIKTITTLTTPKGVITNGYGRKFCTLVAFTLTTSFDLAYGIPNITWFKDNVGTTASSSSSTLNITQIGIYYAVFTDPATG